MKLHEISFKHILKDFSFESRAKTIAILGPSGAGKTTLLRILSELEEVEGELEAPSLSVAFQEPRLIPWLSARENLALVTGEEEVEEWLAKVGLLEDGDKLPAALSGGMCQRLSLARALAFPSELLVLDEPFQGIDLGRKEELKKLIAERERLLLITHDAEDALDLCEEIILVDGPPLEVVAVYQSDEEGIKSKVENTLRKLIHKENENDCNNHTFSRGKKD